MILGIDATNIRSGGGLTHLKEILYHADPIACGFEKVVVWSSKKTLDELPEFNWLHKETHLLLNKSSFWSFFYQIFLLSRNASKKYNCSLLFVPGGTFFGYFRPFVTMSQNMLPFDLKEAFRFRRSITRLRFLILFFAQSFTFKRADGVVFLTNYAKNIIVSKLNLRLKKTIIIPHGISKSFSFKSRFQLSIKHYNFDNPIELLYVSIVTSYKHQINVSKAVIKLYSEGIPVKLSLIGDCEIESVVKLDEIIKNNPYVIEYKGSVSHDDLAKFYKKADIFVYASTCENMPIILIEAMSSGLPIACSNKEPMPEILKDRGVYFDPLNENSIYQCLKDFILDENKRMDSVKKNDLSLEEYTWLNCSNDTFQYLRSKVK